MAELLLYMADRAQHTEAILKPALAQGAWVLCDRYADSTLAYQGAGRGMDPAMIAQINTWVTQGIVPDKTFLLDAPPALLRGRREARSAADRLEAEGLDFHQRVRAGFLDLARAHPQRIVVIDAGQPEEAVFLQILSTYNWGV
jgi:dTMP kinase